MTVYVDAAAHPYGRMMMCHMLADTRDELFAMADKIGVDLRWYQGFDKASCPHFDIAKSKRTLAIQAGAIEVSRARLVAVTREIKAAAMVRVQSGQPHGWERPPAQPGPDGVSARTACRRGRSETENDAGRATHRRTPSCHRSSDAVRAAGK